MNSKHIAALIILLFFPILLNGKNFHCNYKIVQLPTLNLTSVVNCEFSRAFLKENDTFEIIQKEPPPQKFFGNTTTIATNVIDDLVTYIKFKHSNLAMITNQMFLKFPNIDLFDASYSKLKKIDSLSFNQVPNLEHIFLHHNKLTSLRDHVFVHCAKLKSLDLSSNEISEIQKFAFSSLTKLEELNLASNKIKSIEYGTFERLGNLSWLWLNNNQFTKISSQLFTTSNQALLGVFLNGNKINAISPGAFIDLNNLKFLFLNSNGCINMDFKNYVIHDNVAIAYELKKCRANYLKLYSHEVDRNLTSLIDDFNVTINQCVDKLMHFNNTLNMYNVAIQSFQ